MTLFCFFHSYNNYVDNYISFYCIHTYRIAENFAKVFKLLQNKTFTFCD